MVPRPAMGRPATCRSGVRSTSPAARTWKPRAVSKWTSASATTAPRPTWIRACSKKSPSGSMRRGTFT